MCKEKGVTIMGALMGITIFILVAILFMRVLPVYLQNYQVRSSITTLKAIDAGSFSNDPLINVEVLKNKLIAQLDINGLSDIKPEYISVKPVENDNYLVRIKYTVIRALCFNISLMFDFDESQEVHIASN